MLKAAVLNGEPCGFSPACFNNRRIVNFSKATTHTPSADASHGIKGNQEIQRDLFVLETQKPLPVSRWLFSR